MSRAVPTRIAIILALALPALGAGTAYGLSASAVASRTSGVAPLAVFFDARGSSDTGTSSDSMFLDATYAWNFGDTSCAARGDVWQYSGKSKCSDMGPVAGHVYETPGTYTATLTVKHGSQTATKQVTITVQNPNQVFSSTKTVCISTNGDFTGCPSGAQQVTNSGDFTQILGTYLKSGSRVLFHAGQRWSNAGSYKYQFSSPTLIGSFGAGAKPVINQGTSTMFTFAWGSSGLTIRDLEIAGNNNASSGIFISTGVTGQTGDLLVFRVDVHNVAHPFGPDMRGGQPGTSQINHDLAFVECSSLNRPANNGNNDFFGGGERLLFMGNNFGDEQGIEHDLRFVYLNGAVISHNSLGRTLPSNKSVIKMHDITNGSPCTQAVEVANNEVDSGQSILTMSFGPQDKAHTAECVRLVRIERNHMKFTGNGFKVVQVGGDAMLVADNVFDLSNARSGVTPIGVVVSSLASGQTPSNNRIYNNTCYESAGSSLPPACVRLESGTANSTVRNNLVYAPSFSGATALQDYSSQGTVQSNNLVASSNPFAQTNPSLPQDFKLKPGSSAVDAGSNTVPTTGADYSDVAGSRLSGASVDIGAWELNSGGTVAGTAPSPPILLP